MLYEVITDIEQDEPSLKEEGSDPGWNEDETDETEMKQDEAAAAKRFASASAYASGSVSGSESAS